MPKKHNPKAVPSGLPGPLAGLFGELEFAILTPTAQFVVYTTTVVALVLAVFLGASYAYGTVRSGKFHSAAPGTLVDLGGYSMHVDCRGKGAKTVVLDADVGRFSADWLAVRKALGDNVRVCMYDRSGLGWSEPMTSPSYHISRLNDRYAPNMALELFYALKWSGEKGPFVMVGEGLGALVAQSYAARFGGVSSLVLIDPIEADQANDADWLGYWEEQWRGLYMYWIGAYIGTLDFLLDFGLVTVEEKGYDNLPSRYQMVYEHMRGDFVYYRTKIEEYGLMADSLKGYAALAAAKPKSSVPVTVVAREKMCSSASDEANAAWAKRMASFGAEYSSVTRHTVKGSDCMLPVNQPEVVAKHIASAL